MIAMNCPELAQKIQQTRAQGASPQDVARVCLLLSNQNPNLVGLSDLERLKQAWKETGLKLQAATTSTRR